MSARSVFGVGLAACLVCFSAAREVPAQGFFEASLDIGSPPSAGSTTFDSGTGIYTMRASGADIGDGGDQFRFTYRTIGGDFILTARILTRETLPQGTGLARHGLMARWSTGASAKYSMVATFLPVSTGGGSQVERPRHQFRLADGVASGTRAPYVVDDGVFASAGRLPTWMRIERRGPALYSYLAEDANADGAPDRWVLVGSDVAANLPPLLLVGMAHQGALTTGSTITFDRVTFERPAVGAFLFEPVAYETAATGTLGYRSVPYVPFHEPARLGGLGVKNRGWVWADLTVGGDIGLVESLEGTLQLLWNNENRNYLPALLRYTFSAPARVYIAWDRRLTKDGTYTFVSGGTDHYEAYGSKIAWFDVGNDVGTVNAQGWLRIAGSSLAPGRDVIRTNPAPAGDDHFAQGGVWVKDVGAGAALEFLNSIAGTSPPGLSPYVIFVRQCGSAAEPVFSANYDGPGDLGTIVQGGAFAPGIAGSRLRLTDEAIAGSANAVWYGFDALFGPSLLETGFYLEFDAFLSKLVPPDPAAWDPAHGLTIAVVATGAKDRLASAWAAFPPGLGLATLRGAEGTSLGFEGATLLERTEGHPSLAVEIDTFVGGGEPANEPAGGGSPGADGSWHAGLDVNASVASVQTSVQYGVPVSALPDPFRPEGVHVEVAYEPWGRVTAWVSGYSSAGEKLPKRKILSAIVPPRPAGDFVIGFTAATGEQTSTQEVDNLRVRAICPEIYEDSLAVSGPAVANQGDVRAFSASFAGLDPGGTATYAWAVSGANARIVGPANASTVEVAFEEAGQVVLSVTANDGACPPGETAQHVVTVRPLTCAPGISCRIGEDLVSVDISVTASAPYPDCDCGQIRIERLVEGAQPIVLYSGPPSGDGRYNVPLPEGCAAGSAHTYRVTCIGVLGPGESAECTVVCPELATCSVSLSVSLNADFETVHVVGAVANEPPGCQCDEVVLKIAGEEAYRAEAPPDRDFPLPAGCVPGTEVPFELFCVGRYGPGPVARKTIACPAYPTCDDLSVACVLSAGGTAVRVVGSAPSGACNCDELVLYRDGEEIFRGAGPAIDGEFALPEDCVSGTEVLYELACSGPRGEGARASCSVVCEELSACDVTLSCSLDPQKGTVRIVGQKAEQVPGCHCSELVLLRNGELIHRSADPIDQDFALPHPCPTGAEVVFTLVCLGPLGPGLASECTVVCPETAPRFRRGFCNPDSRLDMADPIFWIDYLFRAGPTPPCIVACDSNDDNRADLSDAIYTLNYLFRAGRTPPAPFPGCGVDPTPGALTCEEPPVCP